MLWHGGFRPPAQVAMAAIAVLGLTLYGADLRPTFLNAGLAAAAAGAVASLAWHRDRSSIAPVLAAIAVPCLVGVAAKARARLVPELPLVVALLGATVATTGLAGLALRIEPLAERIAGVWRAQGRSSIHPRWAWSASARWRPHWRCTRKARSTDRARSRWAYCWR